MTRTSTKTGPPRGPILAVACAIGNVLACGGTSPSARHADAGLPADADGGNASEGGNWLGSPSQYAFPVHYSLVAPRFACGSQMGVLVNGSYGAFGIVLGDVNNAPVFCASPSMGMPVGHSLAIIQVESVSYATNVKLDGGAPAPITPGSYSIGYEGVPDDDLCMLSRTGGSALLDIRTWDADGGGAASVATAVSGTITLAAVSPGHVAGSFNVMLVAYQPASGQFDTQHPTPLVGSFDATACPGSMP